MSAIAFKLLFASVFVLINCSKENPAIVVIGAGPSGIAAATRLLKHNFTKVTILEAEDRIGGRIRSVKFGDAYVDLGAEWCHGENGNIVYNMINRYEVLRHMNLSHRLVYSDGNYVDDDIYQSLIEFAESIDASQTNAVTDDQCRSIPSIGECFDKLYNLTFEQKYQNDSKKLRIILDAVDWLESYMLGYDSTFTLDDLSSKSAYKRCEGDIRLNWNGLGYKTILELMMQKFPDLSKQLPIDSNLFLNKEVTKIARSGNNSKTSVQCLDGTEFEVDHVIFTPSLGVLKIDHEKLFEPSLSQEKVRAIKNFGFGAVFKISLHFPQVWWNSGELFGFIWSTEDKYKLPTEFPLGPVKNGKSWLTYSVKFFQAENNPRVLMGFFSGDIVPELEKEPDRVIIDGCMYMFRKFFKEKYNIVNPDQMIRSSWYSNSHFRGTYSYESVKGNSGNQYPEKLSQPLNYQNGNPSVLFAGEATHPYYFSTVHGAIESGYREADRLINLYDK